MLNITIEIRSSGTASTTIDFNTAYYKLLDGYYPKMGEDDRQLTEDFDALITATSDTELETKIRSIELALDFAREHPTGPDGTWITFTPHSGVTTAWQSRLSGGTLMHGAKLGRRWRDHQAKVQVVIERAPYWETKDPVTLALTNRAGTGTTAAIVNHQDAGATDDLYVEIAADQVTGALPTPAIVEYTSTTNDAALVDHLVIGHFVASGTNEPPTAASLIFEGSGTSDANCSGGAYAALSWTGATENSLATWTLASAAFRQRSYKITARLRDSTAYTDLYLKAKLLMGSTVIAETRWTLADAGMSLIEIGSMHIPPFGWGSQVDLGNLTLALYEKRAGSDGSLTLDFLAALPQDSWRKFEAIAGLAYNETLIDNPVNDTLATLYSTSSYKATQLLSEGGPVMLKPGVKNMLYFLHDLTTGAAPIARTATVAVKCHPRRRTV